MTSEKQLIFGHSLKTWNDSVNFTREPIIETIISPKDGFKLLCEAAKRE